MDHNQLSFFDESRRLERLSQLQDPLVALKQYIDFMVFKPELDAVFAKQKKTSAGRKNYDRVMMFKILILQRLYNLSDEQIEYQINDRQSFQRFLGIGVNNPVPDRTTVWYFREALTEAGVVKALFDRFTLLLETQGLITKAGTLIDASFVEVPKQRNTREENALVKAGQTPPEWKETPHKLAQKDLDARWTRKGLETYYGYKNHVKADAESLLVTDYAVTPAHVHDRGLLARFMGPESAGQAVFADSAYKSIKWDEKLAEWNVKNFIHDKGSRYESLSKGRIMLNHLKSKVRCTVEHVFGFIENSMHGPTLEYIGLARTSTAVGLTNLTYNLMRYVQLKRTTV